uniref:PH01B035L11.23 protein n=1 Tax=Phyllostachys edulis TaxID=38705 RepID=L0P3V3_PHYED|nr:PH01B035L11.23 [Phyllostachys edulis]
MATDVAGSEGGGRHGFLKLNSRRWGMASLSSIRWRIVDATAMERMLLDLETATGMVMSGDGGSLGGATATASARPPLLVRARRQL